MKAIILRKIFLFYFLMIIAGITNAQTPEQLFQKGIMKEEGEGSLKEAIELYKSVADNNSADRALRAKALFQMGNCYEKLGQQEARKVYEKLVANFSEQTELVSNARLKLVRFYSAQMSSVSQVVSERQINNASYFDMAYSPDGNNVIINDPDKENLSFALRNLKTGEKSDFTKTGTWELPVYQYPQSTIWSKDSKHIAYTWNIENKNTNEIKTELHVFDIERKLDKVVYTDSSDFWMTDWSKDNANIICTKSKSGNSISLISLTDRIESTIVSLGERQIMNPHFSNDDNFVVFSAQSEGNSSSFDIYSVSKNGGNINPVVTYREKDGPSVPVPNSDEIVFISEHSGTKDLWKVTVKNGFPSDEPTLLKDGLDETVKLMGVLNDGTVIYSIQRLNPEFFYAKLDFQNNDVTYFPLQINRNPSRKILKTLWSPTMSKVAVLTASRFANPNMAKLNIVTQDLNTLEETEVQTDFYTYPAMPWVNPRWTPDEKSILVQAFKKGKDKGIYQFDLQSGEVNDYAAPLQSVAQKWVDLQFSPDGETRYFLWQEAYQTFPQKLIAKSVKTGEEKILAQFDQTIFKFSLSPDGKFIACNYDKSYLIFPTDGGGPKKISDTPENTWGDPLGWSNDNQTIYVLKLQDKSNYKLGWGIWSVPVDGSSPKEAISPEKLSKFFDVVHMRFHSVGNDIYLSMQNKDRIYEAWAIENLIASNN